MCSVPTQQTDQAMTFRFFSLVCVIDSGTVGYSMLHASTRDHYISDTHMVVYAIFHSILGTENHPRYYLAGRAILCISRSDCRVVDSGMEKIGVTSGIDEKELQINGLSIGAISSILRYHIPSSTTCLFTTPPNA